MAEEQGFEPWKGYYPLPVFKTGAFNHSATPPEQAAYHNGIRLENKPFTPKFNQEYAFESVAASIYHDGELGHQF
jgi:hypothetical protein